MKTITMMEDPPASTTCIVEHKGLLWPVVVCGMQHLHQAFIEARPKGDHYTPCILLGTHKLYVAELMITLIALMHDSIWVKRTKLHDYDPAEVYVRADTPLGSATSQSTDLEIVKLKDQHRLPLQDEAHHLQTADFWCNYIRCGSEARKLERVLDVQKEKQELKSRNSKKHLDDGSSDDVLFVSMRHKSRGQPTKHSSNRLKDQYTRRSGQQTRSAATTRSKVSKVDRYGSGLSSSQKNAITSKSSYSQPSQTQRVASKREQSTKLSPAGPDQCYVFVGDERVPFILPKVAISQVDLLARRINHTEEHGAFVDLSKTIPRLTTEAFEPATTWLRHGEFHPRLTVREHRDHIEWDLARAGPNKVETVALAYLGASLLEIKELQNLCYRKLQALYPIAAQPLMMVAACIADSKKWGWESENVIEQWLESHMLDYFWSLMEVEGKAFGAYLRHHDGLREALLEKMIESPGVGNSGREGSQ